LIRLADENFNNDIVRGLTRRLPEVDLVRVQDVGLRGADDPKILEWAAGDKRILLTHDVTTMTRYAFDRVGAGQAMPGVVEVPRSMSVGRAIEELTLFVGCSHAGEWDGQVLYLPLSS